MESREPAGSIRPSTILPLIVSRSAAWYLCLLLVSFLFLGTTALWVSLDHSPGYWDDAWYLTNSLVLYDTLIDHGPIDYWTKFLGVL
jgi:hypothetical protein